MFLTVRPESSAVTKAQRSFVPSEVVTAIADPGRKASRPRQLGRTPLCSVVSCLVERAADGSTSASAVPVQGLAASSDRSACDVLFRLCRRQELIPHGRRPPFPRFAFSDELDSHRSVVDAHLSDSRIDRRPRRQASHRLNFPSALLITTLEPSQIANFRASQSGMKMSIRLVSFGTQAKLQPRSAGGL